MNKYYALLVLFQRGERPTRKYLIGRPFVTEELIDEAKELGYICEVDRTEIDGPRYSITDKGIKERDL